ncbi:restriction endonuclease subunit S [Microcystis aeruginosa FACHB-524]|jgi:type I restriction enzyme S subunit|uniref:restriction endonuclease subunit S n=1 Tax=Microcystis aeruginosa TaxID=1126 RepID=UPI00161DBF32|nr:restriction endonuclease subunit S [Microcystis aeruginosa]
MSLDDICEMVTDGTHASFKDSGKGFPFLTVKDMTENGLDFSGCIHISQEEYDRADAGNSAPKLGDVLFSKDGTVGKVCVVREKREFAVLSSIAILRPKKEIADSSYLGYILGFQKTIDEASKRKTGSAVRRIILKDLKQVEIPLPPLEEQQRIAAILDKADGVRRKRKEAIRLTEELLRSTFLEMFGDPVTNPKGWEVSPFGSLGKLDRGKSKHRPRNDPSLLGGKYPLIQTGDVANSKGVIKKYTQTYSDKGLAQSRMWPAGTLCITIAANIAQTGILTFDSCFPDSIVGFKPNNRVTTEYIQAWLGFLQPRLEDLAPQSAQKNINLQMLRELDVPVPPVDLQSKFSEFVKRIGNNSRNYEKSEAVIDNLFNSLLQKAFRGEL